MLPSHGSPHQQIFRASVGARNASAFEPRARVCVRVWGSGYPCAHHSDKVLQRRLRHMKVAGTLATYEERHNFNAILQDRLLRINLCSNCGDQPVRSGASTDASDETLWLDRRAYAQVCVE